ncbi:MAG: hypothetical protein U1E62_05705 [Alsobacter sp.]
MLAKPWRSRFTARLVKSVTKPAAERAREHPRLFPYFLTDQIRPEPKAVPKPKPKPVLVPETKKKAPWRPQTVWHFIKPN